MSLIDRSPLYHAPKSIKKSVPKDRDGAFRLVNRLDGVKFFVYGNKGWIVNPEQDPTKLPTFVKHAKLEAINAD